ncbi:MAG: Rieske 2Fe-2S domain-containing protein [Streptosporangiaceae bacterium]
MRSISQLEEAEALDRVVAAGQRVARWLRPGPVRDALNGVWLGHPLHPVLAQAPVGAWLSAAVLDGWPGCGKNGAGKHGGRDSSGEAGQRRLVAFGLAAAGAAALAGAADWSEQHEQQMRVGVVHAAANVTAASFYGASLLTRRPAASRALRLAGLAAVTAGGLLGGHISFRLSGGANQAEPVPHLIEPGWHDLMPAAGLKDAQPAKAMLGDVPVVVIRDGGDVHVLAGRCSHLSGPLAEGELDAGRLTCPWHGSVFRITDGAVVHGPATAPQPVFRTRVRAGVIQVCLPDAG